MRTLYLRPWTSKDSPNLRVSSTRLFTRKINSLPIIADDVELDMTMDNLALSWEAGEEGSDACERQEGQFKMAVTIIQVIYSRWGRMVRSHSPTKSNKYQGMGTRYSAHRPKTSRRAL
jgi:hypothetical protein